MDSKSALAFFLRTLTVLTSTLEKLDDHDYDIAVTALEDVVELLQAEDVQELYLVQNVGDTRTDDTSVHIDIDFVDESDEDEENDGQKQLQA